MRKKVGSYFAILLFVLFFSVDVTTIVEAARGTTITLGRGVTTANTGYERKINNSSVHAVCTGASYENGASLRSCKGIVQGSNGNTSTSVGAPGSSLTYDFSAGTEQYMINSVYEDGYSFARIHFRGNYNAYYTVFTFNWGPMS